ncbi:MAG: phosphoribosylanthranilate isomerase [Verrucomicrobiota bacterium]|nr:phosphoribosylanthranilate isomerase [Verrucomicrobiota bacterium]
MAEAVRVKVCGLMSLADAELAGLCGADFLGFISYAQSPRNITLAEFSAIKPKLSAGKKVAVSVTPSVEELRAFVAAGADFFQVHFPYDTPLETMRSWSHTVGPNKLWLAPRLPPRFDAPTAWLPLADTIVLDTFDPQKFGGTGKTGDWAKFARHRKAHPNKTWVLSGGLDPDNIAEALTQTGARFVDVNSGVESSPGKKDPEKLKLFFARLNQRRL